MRLTEEEKAELTLTHPKMVDIYEYELTKYNDTGDVDSEAILLKIENKVRTA